MDEMKNLFCFVAVEFVNDSNVIGLTYWYLCDFEDAQINDWVTAPLGRHNNLQEGIIRKVLFADKEHSPYPFEWIKRIKTLKKERDDV